MGAGYMEHGIVIFLKMVPHLLSIEVPPGLHEQQQQRRLQQHGVRVPGEAHGVPAARHHRAAARFIHYHLQQNKQINIISIGFSSTTITHSYLQHFLPFYL